MNELNETIRAIPMPDRIKRLKISETGFPIPWFVPYKDGVAEVTSADPEKIVHAHRYQKCWVCGETLGRHLAFVIGPMCMVNRISSEPPSHRECAEYAVRTCPFLVKPKMRRNPNKPEGHIPPAGIMIPRNPGVSLIWMTHGYKILRDRKSMAQGGGGMLFVIGEPIAVFFYREGRRATRDEIMHSIETGLPLLRDAAATEGRDALDELELQYRKALELIPDDTMR